MKTKQAFFQFQKILFPAFYDLNVEVTLKCKILPALCK